MSEILDKLPAAAELVAKDLAKGTKGTKAGRTGMSGEQVLRAGMLKQMHCWSYEDLTFHSKRAKRRMLDIVNARSMAHRVPVYRELVKITQWTLEYAAHAARRLNKLSDMRAWATAGALEHYIELARRS